MPSNPDQLYVSLKGGMIERWNWIEGRRLRKWQLGSQIVDIDVSSAQLENETIDLVYTVDAHGSNFKITAHLLQLSMDHSTDYKTLFRSQEPVDTIQVLQKAQCIVASSGCKLIVGSIRSKKALGTLSQLQYDWHEVQAPEGVTSVDARVYQVGQKNLKADGYSSDFDIDVVAGGSRGSLYLYRSLLRETRKVGTKKHAPGVTRMHWHRDAVGAVKWSRDGNYLISGGSETVLVLWQLDTGGKQVLPHLGASIEAITVSNYGASYAIRLADNSVMVISTQELQPATNVPGILLRPNNPSFGPRLLEPLGDAPSRMGPRSRRPAVISSRKSPFSILLAAPAALPFSSSLLPTSSASYLQSIDPSTATQISKQALSRTKITDRNMGPNGNVIEEPHVALIAISHDGEWLASVEEWAPPLEDLDHLSISQDSVAARKRRQTEIQLNFWAWQDASKSWELTSKIERPHASSSADSEIIDFVMDLSFDPSSAGFVTAGNDGTVRIWRPRHRTRGALVVRDSDAEPLMSWMCQQTIALPGYEKHSDEPHRNAIRTACSDDGSLLAIASYCEPSDSDPTSLVHLFNTEQKALLSTRPGLCYGPIVDIGILGRFLVVLSSQLLVWDLVIDQLHFAIDLSASPLLHTNPRAFHLALDRRNATFSIATPTSKETSRTRHLSTLAVFDPESPTPLFATSFPRPVHAVVAAERSRAYFVLDADAELYRVQAPLDIPEAPPAVDAKTVKPAIKGLEQIYGTAAIRARPLQEEREEDGSAPSGSDAAAPDVRARSVGLKFVTQDDLRKLWAHHDPLRLPPMEKLFEQVAALVSGVRS